MTRDLSDRKKSDFNSVIVAGDPILSSYHVRAWKLAGIAAKRVPPEKALRSLHDSDCLDISTTNFSERVGMIEQALRSGTRAIVVGAVSDEFETARRIIKQATKGPRNSRISILDPMKYHPLISETVNLISRGRIGAPRILRLEVLDHENAGVSDFSLFQGLLDGISSVQILFDQANVKKVFAKRVGTDYSNFYVTLMTFDNGSTCQLVAGGSAKQGKLEFSINGTHGMISFNESKTLELPKNVVVYSDTITRPSSLEVLSRMFSDFRNGETSRSADLSMYNIAEAIENSSAKGKPVSV